MRWLNGINALISIVRELASSLLSSRGEYIKKLAVCNLEEDPHQNLTMLEPQPQSPRLQNLRRYIPLFITHLKIFCGVLL